MLALYFFLSFYIMSKEIITQASFNNTYSNTKLFVNIHSFEENKVFFYITKILQNSETEYKERIYLTRKNAYYRKIINESDLIDELKLKNFKIVDVEALSIDEQVEIFSSAEIIVSPTSSALANIIFCDKGTKIFEIMPKYQYQYEKG